MTPDDRPPTLFPWLIMCLGLALSIDLGSIHRLHHSDSLIPILVSLIRYTPFFWEQDRFGMLVPLIALPVYDPLANLLFQDFLDIASGLMGFVLIARYTLRGVTYPLAACVSIVLFVLLTPEAYRFSYLADACYGVWLVPAFGGLILLEQPPRRSRCIVGWLLIALANWVSVLTAMYLVPMVAMRGLLRASTPFSRREFLESLGSLVCGAVLGMGLMRISPYHPTSFGSLPPAKWPVAGWELLRATGRGVGPWFPAALFAAAAGAGFVSGRRRVLIHDPALRNLAAAVVAGLSVWAFLATRSWGEVNGFSDRYLLPPVLMIAVGLAGVACDPFREVRSRKIRRVILIGAVVLCGLSTVVAYGWPSLSGVRRDLDRRLGLCTEDVIASRATHVTGDFWAVWTTVFHARMVLAGRGEERMIWGVTHRCDPTRDLWMNVEPRDVRVALPHNDPEGLAWWNVYKLPPLHKVESRGTLQVLRP